MKTKLLLLCLTMVLGLPGLIAAQTAAPAAPAATAAADANEVVPLIVFEDTPRDDVIKTLARQAGINFLFDPRVTAQSVGPNGAPMPSASISIRFENVTAQAALEAVLANNGLVLVEDYKTKISRITIKDANVQEPLVTKVYQLEYANPTQLSTAIRPAISARGQVLPDVRTSQLLVVATEKELVGVDDLIRKLDTATKQVLIECQIYSTARTPKSVKGIDWTQTLQAQNFTFGNGLAGATGFTSGTANGGTISGTVGTATGLPGFTLNTARGIFPNIAFLNADGISGVLSFLNSDTDTKLVSTPRAVAMDNQLATLSSTLAEPILNITPSTANSPAGVSISYTNIGTLLNVTPRITAGSNVLLKVTTEVSAKGDKITQTVDGSAYSADEFKIQKVDTQVLVPNGNSLVMGGLINDSTTRTRTGVPGFSSVPVLGWAFKSDSNVKAQENLLIFITPTIVEDYDFQYTPSDFLRRKPDYSAPMMEPDLGDSKKK